MRALLRQRSGRWGQVGGQLVRTFHCAIGSVTKATAQDGRGRSVGGNLDYLDRTGAYADRAEDLVATGGRPTDEMREILGAVDRATSIGRSRIAVPIVFELPAELSEAGWRRAVTAVAGSLEALGYPTHWAIHRGHKGAQDQPHVHLVATPRPVRRGPGGWEVSPEGKPGRPAPALFKGREAVKSFRRQVAETINAELERERCPGRWHGGRLIDTGIERPAKKRLPQAEYHRRTRGEASPVRQINAAIDAGDWLRIAASRRAWVADRKAESLERWRQRQERKERQLRAKNADDRDDAS